MFIPQLCVCFLGFSLQVVSFHKVEGWPVAAIESLLSFAALEIKESVSSVLMFSVPGKMLIGPGYTTPLTIPHVQ